MLQTAPLSDLKQRVTAVGLTLKELARRAGVASSTAYRAAAAKHETRRSIEAKLLGALVEVEDARFAHLQKVMRRRQGQLDLEDAR